MSSPTGPTGHEREPDRAALDELERAFARRAEGVVVSRPAPQQSNAGPDDASATLLGGADVDASSVPEDLPSLDEIQSMGDPRSSDVGAPPARPSAPRTIRIDDYSGSVVIEDEPIGGEPPPEVAPSTPTDDASATLLGGAVVDAGLGAVGDVDMGAVGDADMGAVGDVGTGAVEDVGLGAVGDAGTGAVEDVGTGAVGDAGTGAVSIVAIDDEGLPDAVYVEGSLDRSGSRSIVFIEDDAADDAFVPESGRDVRRGIEPRMRERRVAVKRAQGRKRLKWAAVVAGVVVVVVGTLAVLGSPLFAIKADQLVVTGNVYADPERVQAVVDDLVGTPVLLADTQRAERELEAIPWVAAARVRTDFPHGATIEIREREAMATYRGPDLRFRVLDREGRVLDVIENYPLAYVLLEGPDPVDLEPGEFAPRGYAAAAELAKNLTGSVRGSVSSIEVTADGSRLVMHLDGDVDVRFGEARDLFAKLVRLETVLSSGGGQGPRVIDVSTSEVTL
jgi:cell division septal protein FtsQ